MYLIKLLNNQVPNPYLQIDCLMHRGPLYHSLFLQWCWWVCGLVKPFSTLTWKGEATAPQSDTGAGNVKRKVLTSLYFFLSVITYQKPLLQLDVTRGSYILFSFFLNVAMTEEVVMETSLKSTKGAQRSLQSLCIPGGELDTGQLNWLKVSMGLQTCPSAITNGYIYHGGEIKGAKPEDTVCVGMEQRLTSQEAKSWSPLIFKLFWTSLKNYFSSG